MGAQQQLYGIRVRVLYYKMLSFYIFKYTAYTHADANALNLPACDTHRVNPSQREPGCCTSHRIADALLAASRQVARGVRVAKMKGMRMMAKRRRMLTEEIHGMRERGTS